MIESPAGTVRPLTAHLPAMLGSDADFRRLWCAHLISMFGDGLYSVALPWLVYQHTHSGFATTATIAAGAIPYIVVSPIAGAFVDRWDRRRTLVGADLARALLLVAVSSLLLYQFNLAVVIAVAILLPALGRFFVPAQRASVPVLVPAERIVSANAWMEGAGQAAFIAAPALAGLLLVQISAVPLLLIDAITFLGSAWCIVRMVRLPGPAAHAGRPAVFAQIVEGFSVTWRVPVLRTIFLLAVVTVACFAPIPALLAVWVGNREHAARVFGLLTAAFFVGSLIGSFTTGRLGERYRRRAALGLSILCAGAASTGLALSNQTAIGAGALVLLGCCLSSYNISILTLLQSESPHALLGRVLAINDLGAWLLRPVAVLVAGGLADSIGVHPTLAGFAAGMIAVGVVACVLPQLRRSRMEATVSVAV